MSIECISILFYNNKVNITRTMHENESKLVKNIILGLVVVK